MALNARAARAAGHFEYECAANPEKNGKENGQKKAARIIRRLFESFGGVDGTRTRDPRRDRPVF